MAKVREMRGSYVVTLFWGPESDETDCFEVASFEMADDIASQHAAEFAAF